MTTTTDTTNTREMPARIDPAALREWMNAADAPRIVDVRSAAEFDGGHIPGAVNVPLPLVKEHAAQLKNSLDSEVVLVCRTDNRAGQAEKALAATGLAKLHVLTGGMTAWQQADAPVEQGEERWDLERQVRLVAGSLVATSVLASTVVPKAKWVAGFVGTGLLTAAVTNTCAMGSMLSKLPYNKNAEPTLPQVIDALGR